ncbi:putative kinase inhibitor protein [mine drainage metagenome]|uniref:Putative kinase inhibitor protein n=1 Tax=mine drainage metagenome TaxID=410659 RepID=A0A1J5RB72_9ZZZZ
MKQWIIPALALALLPQAAQALTLTSPSLRAGGRLPAAQVLNGFGCLGENRSPALAWSDVPAGTQSFAVTLFDPDAPTGSGWWHWLLFDLPAGTRGLAAGAAAGGLPVGARQGRNDFGDAGYGGACPPPGPAHRYIFTLYALDVGHLAVGPGASGAMVAYQLRAHSLGTARLSLRYGR